jgi:hypothetical protein
MPLVIVVAIIIFYLLMWEIEVYGCGTVQI